MWKLKQQIKYLMKELNVSAEELVERLNIGSSYQVTETQFSKAMDEIYLTPKSKRILLDALLSLKRSQRRRSQS